MTDTYQKIETTGSVHRAFSGNAAQNAISRPALSVLQKKNSEEEELQMKLANVAGDISQRKQNIAPPKANRTGMPDHLKSGIENLSGYSMDDVRVHFNSDKPAQLNALAYAQGTDIHITPGQERHLPHEAWHVVQQRQGRVTPTTQAKGVSINDDRELEKEADVMGGKALNKRYLSSRALESKEPVTKDIKQLAPWDINKHNAEVAESNAQNARLPGPPHPVQIGADQDPLNVAQTTGNEKHFDAEMRNEIRDLLNYLPPSHVVGNPSLARVVCEEATANNPGISYFGGNTLHVVVPFNAASWLYLSVDKWPLGDIITTLMTNAGYAQNNPNVGHRATEVLSRDVIGTGTIGNKLSMIGDNFVNWMLKHETGHSVDDAIQWTNNGHYRQPWAASWMKHDGTDQTEVQMMNMWLGGLGVNRVALNAQYTANTGGNYIIPILQNAIINKNSNVFNVPGRDQALNGYGGIVAGGRSQIEFLEELINEGLDSPWQKSEKGGVPFNGRNYHVEYQHGIWVSYDAARYQNRNSNYQYSGPEEWFAESYAHYFKHSNWKFWRTTHSQWGESINDPAIFNWFRTNLDPINGPGNLILGNILQPIPGNGPIIAPPVPGAVAVPLQPGLLNKIGKGFVKVAQLTGDGLFRILSTVFGLAGGILKYLLYVPLRFLWRYILSLFGL